MSLMLTIKQVHPILSLVFSFSKHQNLLKKFEESQPVHIIGGQKFPMDGSYLIFNCEDENIPLKFVAEVLFCRSRILF